MRFTTAVFASIFALAANAQTTEPTSAGNTANSPEATSVPSATTTREPTPEESLQAEILKCIDACDDDDVNCQARCITVPDPDAEAVNRTTSCVAACPQGKGSEADNAAYADCVQGCIDKHYLTTTFTGGQPTGQPTGTGSGSEVAATPTPSVSTVTSGSTTFEITVTPTPNASSSESANPGSQSTDAPNAGAMPFSPIGATGLLGLVAAFFAI